MMISFLLRVLFVKLTAKLFRNFVNLEPFQKQECVKTMCLGQIAEENGRERERERGRERERERERERGFISEFLGKSLDHRRHFQNSF